MCDRAFQIKRFNFLEKSNETLIITIMKCVCVDESFLFLLNIFRDENLSCQ